MLYTIQKEDYQYHRDDCRELTCKELDLFILAKIEAHLVESHTIHNRPATERIRTTHKFYHKHNEFCKETFLTLYEIGLLCVCVCVLERVCVCVCTCVCVLVVSYRHCIYMAQYTLSFHSRRFRLHTTHTHTHTDCTTYPELPTLNVADEHCTSTSSSE